MPRCRGRFDTSATARAPISNPRRRILTSRISRIFASLYNRRFQVMSLPSRPVYVTDRPLANADDYEREDPATIRGLIMGSLEESRNRQR